MIQQKSKLTIVLKIYSVLALLLAVYISACYVLVYIIIQHVPFLIVVNNAEVFVSVAVIGLLVWIIYTNKAASALFIPCLILSIVHFLTLLGYIIYITVFLPSDETFNIWPFVFWYAANAVVYLLIAIDARSGLRFAQAELLTAAALTVLKIFAAVVSALRMPGFSFAILTPQMRLGYLTYVLSPAVIIVLILLRTHVQRKDDFMSKYNALWDYVQKDGRPSIQLSFAEIHAIAGIELDHSFLTYKKELAPYGYKVGKIF